MGGKEYPAVERSKRKTSLKTLKDQPQVNTHCKLKLSSFASLFDDSRFLLLQIDTANDFTYWLDVLCCGTVQLADGDIFT